MFLMNHSLKLAISMMVYTNSNKFKARKCQNCTISWRVRSNPKQLKPKCMSNLLLRPSHLWNQTSASKDIETLAIKYQYLTKQRLE